MQILDIDLDFFLSKIVYGLIEKLQKRPSQREFKPWTEDEVRRFLEEKCGLSTGCPLPGKLVVEHDEVFADWRERILKKKLVAPFSVVHVDAHADLGMGDGAYMYIANDLLGRPIDQRPYPKANGLQKLCSGNYLLYAIACRWIDRLTYVYHPKTLDDIPWHIMKQHDISSGAIQLKYYGAEASLDTVLSRSSLPLQVEQEVAFEKVSGQAFQAKDPFDMVYLAQSPKYCPRSSDKLIRAIREYIDEHAAP
jgi:hypothetical protein